MDDTKSLLVKQITNCRVCQSSRLEPILSFGHTPLANRYLTKEQLSEPEIRVPLEVVLCMDCGCVQLKHTVDPKVLYTDYLYTSSTVGMTGAAASGSLSHHFSKYAQDTVDKFGWKPGDERFVVGIGGNDGPLEMNYKRLGFKVLNVEASTPIAMLSEANGVPTFNVWFNEDAAKAIAGSEGHADLITCNHCFAHMPDINGVMRAIKILLKPDGWFVFEEAYWDDTVRGNHFDQIYHEHCFYWTVRALDRLFSSHGLAIADVEFNGSQGGSIRVFAKWHSEWSKGPYLDASEIIKNEKAAGLFDLSTYIAWNKRIEEWRRACLDFLEPIFSVCCYGVPAKFTMISEQLSFSSAWISYAVEDSPIKVGRFTPGSHIPIVARQHFLDNPTEHCIITATNYADRIIAANPQYRGKWMVLLPEPMVINHE